MNSTAAIAQMQTFIVTTAEDSVNPSDNVLSLREALEAANTNDSDGDVILFDISLDSQVITLVNGELTISDDVVIGDDLSPTSVIIDAGNAGRILSINTGSASGSRSVQLYDLSFMNGTAENGGAVYIEEGEDVTCKRCAFANNMATGDAPGLGGGAVFTAGGLSLMYVDFTGNIATNGSGNGGAVLIAPTGSITMIAGSFESNVANRAGGAVENNAGSASFEGVLFSNNIAGPDSMSAAPGNGGAIHVSGTGTTMIQGGVAVGNLAFSEGGAFWNGSGTMTVEGVTIGGQNLGEFNIAMGPNADNGGGGLFNIGGTLNVIDATILANKANGASGSGGGILSDGGTLTVSGSMFRWNSSSRAGGAIESTNGAELLIEDVSFLENTTGPAPGNGAAIHVTGTGNTTIIGGLAINNEAASEGGAFWNGSGTMMITGTQIGGTGFIDANIARGADATNGGGGLFNNGGVMIAENISVLWNIASGAAGSGGGILSDGGSLTVSNSLVQGNNSMRAGGGIESTSGADLVLDNVNFVDNVTGSAPGNGGALHITGSGNTMIKGGSATGNTATSEGGAFWNGSGTMTIDGTQIGETGKGNVASGDEADNGGGGVFGINGTLIVKNAWIAGNIADGASGSGGGVLNDGGSLMMENTIVQGNMANRAGGGIESNGAPDADGTARVTSDSLVSVTLSNNIAGSAPGNGGGFHLTGPGSVSFVQSLASGNEAGNEGGGLWNSGAGMMTVLNSTVSGNSAPKGGGLFQQAGDNSSFATWYSTIARNESTTGGGFQSDGGLPVLFNTILAENMASDSGKDCAGMFNSNGYNLFENLEGCSVTTDATDLSGIAALLQDLSDDGGPTGTHGLQALSPAIDAGSCSAEVQVDQRGAPRMAPCDIGAFESDGAPIGNSDITFTLIDALTDMPVPDYDPIQEGSNIIRSLLPDEVNIRANIPSTPGSVVFDFNNTRSFRTENVPPFALFGDVNGNYASLPLESSLQIITATPYSMQKGMGEAMPAGRVSFSIVEEENAVMRFVLVDADTDQDVMVLEDNITIDLSELPSSLNLRAEAGPGTYSVTFSVGTESRSEVVRPFALFGDIEGDYFGQAIPPGMYELTATPYSGAPGESAEGVSLTIRANITDGSPSAPGEASMSLPGNEYTSLSTSPSSHTPKEYALHENYPNPFNPSTEISFAVPESGAVELSIYNMLGQRVSTLLNDEIGAGVHRVSFDAKNLPSGVYIYRLVTTNGAFARKMILSK